MFILNAPNRYSKLIRISLCTFSLAIYLSSLASFAQGSSDSQLDKLETKLFQHTYAKDTADNRIDRLEKLIFGESQKGSNDERLAALVKAVPNLDNTPVADSDNNTPLSKNGSDSKTSSDSNAYKKKNKSENIANDLAPDKSIEIGNYPAVTAMETKLLGKDHAQEPIQDRLARLEKKVLGSVSTSDDLSERVDKLKVATGIDIARKPGSINDWIEDDDDMTAQAPSGRSAADSGFSKNDAYKDMQRSYGDTGMAYAAPKDPFYSPYFPDKTKKKGTVSIKSFGLSQQVTALEHEIFGKSYEHDPLPARVNRLEVTVFPGQKPAVDTPLPQRVQTLLAKVPIHQEELQHLAKIYNIAPDDSLANADTNNLNDPAAVQRSRSNLSKIMGSLGNMLSGGMAGGYPMQSGNYVMDPASGLLIDPNTGYVVNPNSGTMYGAGRMSPYGMGNYGFNNYNMAPFGSPFGMGGGFGGGGFGFGFR